MGRYTVTRNYRSGRGAFAEGDVVELDDTAAAWFEIDSPGLLVAAGEEPSEETSDGGSESTEDPTEAAEPVEEPQAEEPGEETEAKPRRRRKGSS